MEELRYTEALLADPLTMAFNDKWGGTVAFPEEQWPAFHQRYCTGHPHYRYYHIYNLDHVMVGEVSTRYDSVAKAYMLNIKVMDQYRGNHHASDALCVFLEILFEELEIVCIDDDVAIDNDGGIALLKRFGFQERKRGEDAVFLRLCRKDYLGVQG